MDVLVNLGQKLQAGCRDGHHVRPVDEVVMEATLQQLPAGLEEVSEVVAVGQLEVVQTGLYGQGLQQEILADRAHSLHQQKTRQLGYT